MIINLGGVSKKLYFNLIFTMQTYKELNLKPDRHFIVFNSGKVDKVETIYLKRSMQCQQDNSL